MIFETFRRACLRDRSSTQIGRALSDREIQASKVMIRGWINSLWDVSSSGFGRIQYYEEVRRRLDFDRKFRRFYEQETSELPQFYVDGVRKELGPFWEWLPQGALGHDPNAYLRSE